MQISRRQLFWLVFSMEIVMTLLFNISPTIAAAGQDAWTSLALAGAGGLCIMYVGIRLNRLYPKQTIIQYSQAILGKWGGKIIVVPYMLMWYYLNSMALRNSASFVYLSLFSTTPLYIVMITMLLLVVYVIYSGGIVGITRCAELMGPLILLVVLSTFILSLNNLDWQQLRPVWTDTDLKGIMKGAVPAFAYYADAVIFTMVYAFLADVKREATGALWGMALAALLVSMASAMVIMTFGPLLPGRMIAPFFGMTRFISVLGFIQNVDILVVVIWMFSAFIQMSLFVFISLYGTAQWLGIKDWRKLIWIIVPLALVIAMLPPNSVVPVKDYVFIFWIPYVIPVNIIGIPLLLWIVGSIRSKKQQSKEGAVT